MSNKTIEAAAEAVLENFHAPDQSHPSWHLNPEAVAKAALLAALPALGEGLLEVLSQHRLREPDVGTLSWSSQCVCSCGHETRANGVALDYARVVAERHLVAAVIEHLRSKIEEGEMR